MAVDEGTTCLLYIGEPPKRTNRRIVVSTVPADRAQVDEAGVAQMKFFRRELAVAYRTATGKNEVKKCIEETHQAYR